MIELPVYKRVCASAVRTKLASALRARKPLLSSSASRVRWTLAPDESVRSVLSADTKAILMAAWSNDAELKSFADRGGSHFAQPLVQQAHGLEMHGAIAWSEGAGLPQQVYIHELLQGARACRTRP